MKASLEMTCNNNDCKKVVQIYICLMINVYDQKKSRKPNLITLKPYQLH